MCKTPRFSLMCAHMLGNVPHSAYSRLKQESVCVSPPPLLQCLWTLHNAIHTCTCMHASCMHACMHSHHFRDAVATHAHTYMQVHKCRCKSCAYTYTSSTLHACTHIHTHGEAKDGSFPARSRPCLNTFPQHMLHMHFLVLVIAF